MAKIKMNNSELTFEVAFEKFLNNKHLKNVKEETIKNYKLNYKLFTDFFDKDTLCKDIDENVYLNYKQHLMKKHKNEQTINTYLRHVKAILNFMMKNNYVQEFEMQLLTVDDTIKDVFTEEELRKLLKKPNMDTCSFSEYRTWVITNYILGTGNRINTVRNILIKDIDFKNNEILLRVTKKRRQYNIPMPLTLSNILENYLKIRGGNPDDYLFCTETGTQLSKGGIVKAFARYATSRGVEKTSEHLLRHTFAKLFYMNGGDVVTINYILGHKELSMTQRYLNLMCCDIKAKDITANPLDKLTSHRIKMR